MSAAQKYSYDLSVKSDASDELINVYLLRPVAGVLVRGLFATPVTPNHLTISAFFFGLVAAGFYLFGTASMTALGGVCITLKDLLDSADGQLARARRQYSRAGRFLDSIGDFVVNLSVFAAIGYALSSQTGSSVYWALALAGFAGITLRVSYHVYYHTSFLHLQELYETNRITEEVRRADLEGDSTALMLQRVFQTLYGWQDKLMVRIDGWCRRGAKPPLGDAEWFGDEVGLRLSGLLGLGTELMLLTICSLFDQLTIYLYCNVLLMNCVFLGSIWYRRKTLTGRVGFPRG